MKRLLLLLTLALLMLSSTFVGAAEVVSERADGTATFLRGDLGVFDGVLSSDFNAQANGSSDFRMAATNTMKQLAAIELGATGTEDFRVKSTRGDQLGMVHVRFDQYINDLKVDGAQMILHADRSTGVIQSVNGDFFRDQGVSYQAMVDGKDAVASALRMTGVKAQVESNPELTYVVVDDAVHLAYKVMIRYEQFNMPHADVMYASADDGQLLAQHATIHTAKSWRTYDMNNSASQGALPGTLVCNGSGSCGGDVAAQAAHDGASTTWDYYNAKFGRDSLNGSGMTMTSSVHFDSNYNNAFWNGSQMVYGDGDGTTFIELSRSLDVVAHELTHGVTDHESDLIYQKESGALNEALSDIFGAAVEAYSDGAITSNTWLLGEDIYTPGTSGDALRYMNNPTADGYSKDYYPERLYSGSCSPSNSNDQCGVHGNSGIANMAFYLMVVGGSHPRGVTSNSVPVLGMSKAEQIFYRAQVNYLTANSNFEAARTATAQAATDLYGATEANAVHEAWNAVGAPGSGGGGGGGGATELSNGVTETGLSGTSGSETFFTLEVPSGATDLSFVMSGGSGDADMHVRFGSAPTTSTYDCRPYKSGNSETCTFASPSTGTYHVMLRGYSSYSGTTLTGSYTGGGGGGGGDDVLENGVPKTGLSGASSSETNFTLEVPAGATDLSFVMSGGTGDADMYVRHGSAPTTSTYDCRPYKNGNNETCTFASPASGTWHVMLRGYSAYSGTRLTGSFTAGGGGGGCGDSGSVTGISGSKNSWNRYYQDIPACATSLTVTISGGSGDADLYVKSGSEPSTSSYNCRPYKSGNNETCTFTNPVEARWHIGLRGYSAYSGVTLSLEYE